MPKAPETHMQHQPGDRFTISGCGWGSRGQEVFGDYNPKTKRRCKCVKLLEYVVGEVVASLPLLTMLAAGRKS